MLTLEEAIKAEEAETLAYEECLNSLDDNMPTDMWNELNKSLGKQMDYHRQLAEWLRKLEKYEEGIEKIKEQINDYKGRNNMWDTANGMQFALECLEVNADDSN